MKIEMAKSGTGDQEQGPGRRSGLRATAWRSTAALLLGLALLGPGNSQGTGADPARWDQDIRAFEAADRTNPPPAGAVLFVGSSSIRMWKSLVEDFKDLPVIQRGFGGSQMADLLFYADRIVLPYRPRAIVVYEGDNDLAAGVKPAEVLSSFQAFVAKVRRGLPETRICFIAVKPSPARWKLAAEFREVNRLIAEFAHTSQGVQFIDVFTPMLDSNGQPRPELFTADMLHMNAQGYALWRDHVRPCLTPEL